MTRLDLSTAVAEGRIQPAQEALISCALDLSPRLRDESTEAVVLRWVDGRLVARFMSDTHAESGSRKQTIVDNGELLCTVRS